MSETNIVALHDHLPQRRQRRTSALPFHRGISISSPPRQGLFFSLSFCACLCVVYTNVTCEKYFLLNTEKSLQKPFKHAHKNTRIRRAYYSYIKKKRQTSFTSKQQTFPPKTVSAFSSLARRPGTRGGSAKRCSFPFFLTRRPTNNARPAINWRARIERRR